MTVRYFIANAQTGIIERVKTVPNSGEIPEAPSGCEVIEHEYSGPLPAYWTGAEVLPLPPQPSPAHEWSGQSLAWVLNPSLLPGALAEAQASAQAQVDDAAGRARLRYITDVPGQQATYTRKEQQARQWVDSGYSGPAPSFIAAEAQALGETPQHIAQQVITLADYWAYVKGPEIEAARIKHKAAVRAAATLEAVQSALNDAINELEAL